MTAKYHASLEQDTVEELQKLQYDGSRVKFVTPLWDHAPCYQRLREMKVRSVALRPKPICSTSCSCVSSGSGEFSGTEDSFSLILCKNI